jgi:hypothetical protein
MTREDRANRGDSKKDDRTSGPRETAAQRYYSDFMIDVLVYTVVLNLFVEYVDSIVIDSFTVSLLTAIVMKLLIDLINHFVALAKGYFGRKGSTLAKVLFGLSAWAIMFFSKIVILEVVQIIFEEDVDLGGFVNVLMLVIAMMVARRLSTAVFVRLGGPGAASDEPISLA